MDNDDLIKLRDLFRECANIIDELIELDSRTDKGEDVTKELENVTGRFVIRMMQLNNLRG